MIHKIFSSLPSFKTLEFHAGLNVLLSEKTEKANERQTRNRAGKSSFVELVHFLLGSSADKGSLFRNPALNDYSFGMTFDLASSEATVRRSGSEPSQIIVHGSDEHWPVKPTLKDGTPVLSNDNWKAVLGQLMFGFDETGTSYGPTFRSMLSYFIRRDRSGGMANPVKHFSQQLPVDVQVNLSYLLGLDWKTAHGWHGVRERESQLTALKKSLKDGAFDTFMGSSSALRSELVILEDRIAKMRQTVSSFRVEARYHDLEREAADLTQQMNALADENFLALRYAKELETNALTEQAPNQIDVESAFKEAGIVFPELVKRRFEEVVEFHESVVRNRKAYLASELKKTLDSVARRDTEKKKLDDRRAKIMEILNSTGALEQFSRLQTELSQMEARAEIVRQKHDNAEALESGSTNLKVERAQLVERLRRSYNEEDDIIKEAILTFNEVSMGLYEDDVAGNLEIKATDNGPEFIPHIQGGKSKGVNNMQIFCFDMMLVILSLNRGRSPGFLIHDSHLFDGVDERQKAKALVVGQALAEKKGFQYIVTMNEDDVPTTFPGEFHLDDYVLPVRLTDATEDGGLFGIRFD